MSIRTTSATVDAKLVKKGYTKTSFDKFRLLELKKCIYDPVYFIETYMKIQHPTKGAQNFTLYPYQRELLTCWNENRFAIAMLPRQMGKSTCAAGYLLWKAMFTPDSTILIAAHQYSGAAEIMSRIRYAYEEFPDFLRAGVVEYNKGSIKFDNGSRIIAQATTEKTGRGLALSLVYLDEFAFLEPNLAEEFWISLAPTLSTGGSCIITSTPNNETDQFAQIWHEAINVIDEYGNDRPNGVGKNGFKAFTTTWDAIPERDEEFKRKMMAQLGESKWSREFELQFITDDETLINPFVLKDMQGIDPIETIGKTRWYSPILPNKVYIVALDPSMGTGGDNAAITVWQLPEFIQVAEWIHNNTMTKGQIRVLLDIMTHLNNELRSNPDQVGKPEIYWSVENNSLGEAALQIIDETGEDIFPGDFVHEPRKKRRGFNTTHKTKIEACSRLKSLVETRKIQIRSKPLVYEMKNYIRSARSYKAKGTATDDIVSSLLLAIRIIKEVQTWDSKIYERLAQAVDQDDYEDPLPVII